MFIKFSKCEIIGASVQTKGRVAARKALGSFDYDDRGEGFFYVAVRACTADVPNLNRDMLPHIELKTAYRTFLWKPVYVNHANTNLDRARGFIIDAVYHDEDPDDRWIEILMEMDEATFPKLCALIRSGEIDTVSMGLNCETTTCSICGNVAEDQTQFCNHIKQKGREFNGVMAYEICNKIAFFEESWVYDPADPTATVQALEVESVGSSKKTASVERKFGPDNFYQDTEVDYQEIGERPLGDPDYTSDSGSEYWHFPEGVVRGSNHWGYGIGGCHWYLDGNSRQTYDVELYGYADWSDFRNTDNYNYSFDRLMDKAVDSYVSGGASGTLEDHIFGDMQWRHTPMNDDIYEEAKKTLKVVASTGSGVWVETGDGGMQFEVYESEDDEEPLFSGTVSPADGEWDTWITSSGSYMTYGEETFPTKDQAMAYIRDQAASEGFSVVSARRPASSASDAAREFISEYSSLGLEFNSYDDLAAEAWAAVENIGEDEEFYADMLADLARHYKVSKTADNMVNKLRIPEEIDMQNSDRVCPICGSPDFDGLYCDVCEYVEYAEGFGDIDTEEAQSNKRDRKDLEDAEIPDEEITDGVEDEYEDEGRIASRTFDISINRDECLSRLASAGYSEGIDYDLTGTGDTVASYSVSMNGFMTANGHDNL